MIGGLTARLGNRGTEMLVAGAIGLIVAIGILLVPVEFLQELVLRSGLPAIFPPADPPLGLTAVSLIALTAGLACFGATYGMMLVLDKASALFEEPVEDVEDRPARRTRPARARRRDQHPDAPVPTPLSARELGDPDETPRRRTFLRAGQVGEESARPLPWRRNAADEPAPQDRLRRIRPLPETAPEPEPENVLAPEPVQAHDEMPPEPVIIAPVEEPDLATADHERRDMEAELAAWSARYEPSNRPPALADEDEDGEAPVVSEPAVAETIVAPAAIAPEAPIDIQAVEPVQPLPARPQPEARPTGQESIAELMARLERAMAQRTQAAPVVPATPAVPAEPAPVVLAPTAAPVRDEGPAASEPMDDRLRSALENLKRFAPRQG